MPSIVISLNEDKKNFLLTGDIDSIVANRQLSFSLKKLGYSKLSPESGIPYADNTKIDILKRLNNLFIESGFIIEESNEIQETLDGFYQEQRTFDTFSGQARAIRNYQFEDLQKDKNFIDFSQVVSKEFKQRTPRDFQWLSAFHMAFSQKSCNFSVPGAGKTTIVYAAYAYLKNIQDVDKKVNKLVVIGPKSSFAPWENEYKECFGGEITSQRISGEVPIDERKQHLASGNPAELTLISFHSVPNLQNEIDNFIKNNNVMLVVDEAHKIKNPAGKNTRSILEIGKEAKSRIVLTGTPLPNGYQDLYSLYKFIYPYHYKNILQFHYGNLEQMTKNNEMESDRVNKLINNISPFFIRIKKGHLGLPDVTENSIIIDMDPSQRKVYDFIEERAVESFKTNDSSDIKDILNKAKLIRLRQAATNPLLLLQPIADNLDGQDENLNIFSGHSETIEESFGISNVSGKNNKIEFSDDDEKIANIEIFQEILKYKEQTPNKFIAIKDLLQDQIFLRKEKVIIWTIFIKNAQQLQSYLKINNIDSKLLLGYIEQDERERTIANFNNPGNFDFQVVIANPFTVAESISLHKGCRNAIYLERDYNCGNFLQSKDRIHRVGLTPDQITNYYYFLSRDSVDVVIDQKLSQKTERMLNVIDGEIPLLGVLEKNNENDLIQALIESYDKRTH